MSGARYPSLFEVNTRVRLSELSAGLGHRATLDDVTDAELDQFAHDGFDLIWFFVHADLGAAAALARLLERLRARGLRLVLGRDPQFAGWPDTLQLKHGSPRLQDAMLGKLKRIAHQCDGVRCDFAPDVRRAAAVITFLSPSLRSFHLGQREGKTVPIPAHLSGEKKTFEEHCCSRAPKKSGRNNREKRRDATLKRFVSAPLLDGRARRRQRQETEQGSRGESVGRQCQCVVERVPAVRAGAAVGTTVLSLTRPAWRAPVRATIPEARSSTVPRIAHGSSINYLILRRRVMRSEQ